MKKPLSQKTIETLRVRKRAYIVHDTRLPGYAIRVQPTGRKTFIVQTQSRGYRSYTNLGCADDLTESEARGRAIMLMRGDSDQLHQTPFDIACEAIFGHCACLWKPSTQAVNWRIYKTCILPFFQGRNMADIQRADVMRWFTNMGNRPGAANRALPVLSILMQYAEIYGTRPENSNPCKRVTRYKITPQWRFLSPKELVRFGKALRWYQDKHPQIATFYRLLLLTGCRKGEIASLQWTYYRQGHLYLPDSKTGPRTVFLSSPARAILDSIPRTTTYIFSQECVYPAHWKAICQRAKLQGMRVHDLRHTFASIALQQGENIINIGTLLGHQDRESTLQYAHLAEDHIRQAACTTGDWLGRRIVR